MASAYGKRPLWHWITLYIIIGVVVYGLIYYFVLAKKSGYNYTNQQTPNTNQQTNPSSSVPVAKNSVQITNFSFSPATLTIKAGETVTWTNQDSAGHSATADDTTFDTGVLNQGQSGSFTFSKAGAFTYYCSVHPSMQGKIIV